MSADTLFHPTFLYESLWNLLGVVVLLLLDRHLKLRNGMMLLSYIVWYTLDRIPIESIRLDHAQEFTLLGITARTNTWTSVIMFLVAVGLLVYSIITRPKTAEERAEAEKVFRDDYQDDTENQTAELSDDVAQDDSSTTQDSSPDKTA